VAHAVEAREGSADLLPALQSEMPESPGRPASERYAFAIPELAERFDLPVG
jgi:hypothetical protein